MTIDRPANRLARTSSPYLLAHAHNPVDWYPWGDEAFAKARTEDKPIFLSIGYHACHWCHVMEKESFEDEQVAAFLNRHFVSIKVDREERPDVDQIYMTAVTALTGSGGWPMSIFLTPDKKPFFAGTYFPPKAMPGRPGFMQLISELALAYRETRGEIDRSAQAVTDHVAADSRIMMPERALDRPVIQSAADIFYSGFDHRFGGFGSAPKFPQAAILSFLFRAGHLTGEKKFTEAALGTLDRMAEGGIYDQLGGGFHRYSVDQKWLVPHFEKMLYDNALLVIPYLEAYQLTKDRSFLGIVHGTLGYLMRDLTSPDGAFYASQDADSEGEEGKYYLWRKQEIEMILGPEADWLCRYFDVTDEGNFEHGANILNRGVHSRSVRNQMNLGDPEFESRPSESAARLLAERQTRVTPAIDDKILASWNGLAVSALAQAYRVAGDIRYLISARQAADFILGAMTDGDSLYHSWHRGRLVRVELLEDYAYFAAGLIDLYQASFDESYLSRASALTRRALQIFGAENAFYTSPADAADLIVRPRDLTDGATPSASAVMIRNLLKLGLLTGDTTVSERGQAALTAASGLASRLPQGAATLLADGHFQLAGPVEIALTGDGDEVRRGLITEIFSRYLPNKLLVGTSAGVRSALPLLHGRQEVDRPTCFVCHNQTCRRPASDLDTLRSELDWVEHASH